MIGKSLNHYEVEALLGVGGMGEVYRAKDTRLGRAVAVKVLPAAFDQYADRIVRFEREARVLASLNHPSIASLYGMEKSGNKHFLVMELVEGETLAECLRRGPIAAEEALQFAQQMAEALEAAHHSGVVHRDLKPANIKINNEGRIKVLDFGLAKAMDAPADVNLSNSPTISVMATNAGVILGTAAYMSPEQAKGLPADSRSDIFSFGCVLFEMLSGRQPFQGETTSELLASVLLREPDWTLLPSNIKPRVHELVRRCMDKNPRRRWQAAGDVRVEIETLLSEPLGADPFPPLTVKPLARWRLALPVVATALVVGLMTGFAVWNLKPTVPAQIYRFEVPLPEYRTFNLGAWNVLALSPDGTKLVYAMNNQLFLYVMATRESRPIAGAGGQLGGVFFSPDGQWLGFQSAQERALKKIAIAGGTAIKICDTQNVVFGATWHGDHIVFAEPQKGVLSVSAYGGEPQVLAPVPANQIAHGPQIIDSGRAVLFTLWTATVSSTSISPDSRTWDSAQVVVQPLPSGERRVIVQGGSDARYVPSGHLIYMLGGNVVASPFDLKTLNLKEGGQTVVVQDVMRSPVGLSAATQLSFSNNGTLVYVPFSPDAEANARTLALVDTDGKVQQLPVPSLPFAYPRFSPDGQHIAVATEDTKSSNVHIYDLSGGSSLRPLTFDGRNTAPIWTEDGRHVIFTSDQEGKPGLFRKLANGAGSAERLTTAESGFLHAAQSIHPSTGILAFINTLGAAGGIWTRSLERDEKPMALIDLGKSVQIHAAFSPDGRWIAYMSTEMGAPRVFVQPYPLTGAKYLIADNASYPAWSTNGSQLFYVSLPNRRVFAVDIRTEPSFSVGEKTYAPPLTRDLHPVPAVARNYDIHPTTQQFLVVLPAQAEVTQESKPHINVVLNWFEELKELVPVQ